MRILLLTSLVIVVFALWSLIQKEPLYLTPIGSTVISEPPDVSSLQQYGFLPFWTMSDAHPLESSSLDVVVFFALQLDDSGEVVSTVRPGEAEPGYHRLTNGTWERWRAAWPGTATQIAFTAYDDSALKALTTNPEVRSAAVRSILSFTRDYGFDGIHVDLEPRGSVSAQERAGMTLLIKELAAARESLTLIVDVYGRAHEQDSLWDVESLSPYVDHLLLMTYDYHRPASIVAGPVAPLYAPANFFGSHSVMLDLASTSMLLPNSKLILGLPLYGYSWEVTEPTAGSATIPQSGRLETLVEIGQLLPDAVPSRWDPLSLSPWTSFEEADTTRVVHYENLDSLSLKVGLAREAGLGGVGYWALGYTDDFDALATSIMAQ